MNLYAASNILAFATNFGIAFILLLKSHGKRRNVIFSGVPIGIALWGFGATFASTTPLLDKAFFWWQIAYVGLVITCVAYFHFVYAYTNQRKVVLFYSVYLLAAAFLIFILFFRELFFGELVFRYNQFWWIYWPASRSAVYLIFYISFWWVLLIHSFFMLLKAYLRSTGPQRTQLKYFILGSAVGWIGAEGNFIPKFLLNTYPYLNFLVAIYPAIFVYAILKYRLMDIKVAITRAGLFISVYTLVLGLPFAIAFFYKNALFELFHANWWIVPLIIMAFLATAGPFLYIYLQKRAEERLLREQKRYQDTLKHAAIGMSRIRNLRRLLSLITHIVTKTVHISFAAIYLFDEPNGEYVLQVCRDSGRIPLPKISADQTIISLLHAKHEPIVYEEIRRRVQDMHDPILELLERDLRSLGASVVVPSFLDNNLNGFIVLGEKISGQAYTPEDLSVFQVLATQAALAIENAQFYEQAKEMQAQIAQAEKMATVGTMADGLSHQINNRFYALSLIAGDTIDTIKLTDTKNCTPEVQEMIKQVNSALDRIQSNVMQGGEVVKGILKYTRKGNEGLEALTMDMILDGTLAMVQYKVKLHEIDMVRDYPVESTPKIKGNLVQLEEAFFNFIDNAYDAMVERRTMLKEPGYKGKIAFIVRPKGEMVEIIIQDNGMGVKPEDQKRLFTPFFTTKVSSRRGTGLGLYVIRNIIESNGGKISMESEYKVGTRFILELPEAKA